VGEGTSKARRASETLHLPELALLAIRVAGAGGEEPADEREAEEEGKREDVFEEGRAAVNHVLILIGFGFFGGDDGRDVFQKVQTAFFASAALALLMRTRWTLIAERGVAAGAEARDVADLDTAFGAGDGRGRGWSGEVGGSRARIGWGIGQESSPQENCSGKSGMVRQTERKVRSRR